ncbi:glycine betaine ABC transporter substrate-binding protein [Chromohalobacter sarecensis]|uniref:Glycine betaine ABC transporter substrate-binding protein n=1 Tax=Chromohalobacter sarecensis TaxID=245294 RepID=A0ABV9D1L8_9GAMM|nr:glycine betaine ABC transporter substrate-binding protein [Chromohalobacter sarecensis]MCK0715112.1 glycine/betaine ABC transporter [Chromohalobacter sarecensis]
MPHADGMGFINHDPRGIIMTKIVKILCTALLGLSLPMLAQAQSTPIRMVVPPWPGVTVKTEILSQLLDTLGYSSKQIEMGATVGYKTMETGDSDIMLAGWMPAQKESYDAAMKAGAIVDVVNNVSGARMGFAVPGYVYDAGITSAEQLDQPENRERFGAEYYSIESGAQASIMVHDAAEADIYGLQDWQILDSSTPAMLSEVDAAYNAKKWIAFYGWTPHWMAIKYDMHILDDPEEVYGENQGRSEVRTIVRTGYADENSNIMQLLKQFKLTANEQSQFISAYSLNERPKTEVAHEWLVQHPQRVAEFLKGVKTRDGKSAQKAYEESLR